MLFLPKIYFWNLFISNRVIFITHEILTLSQMFKHLCENHISDNMLLKELDKKSLSLLKSLVFYFRVLCFGKYEYSLWYCWDLFWKSKVSFFFHTSLFFIFYTNIYVKYFFIYNLENKGWWFFRVERVSLD